MAVALLRAEIDVSCIISQTVTEVKARRGRAQKPKIRGTQDKDTDRVRDILPKPPAALEWPLSAIVSEVAAKPGARLFCIGNPSNHDLESARVNARIAFEPSTWHASVGACLGYSDRSGHALQLAQARRGRAPTRGELKAVRDAPMVEPEQGVFMLHSCWTYWGHSGAPLFNEAGHVVGLHCAWDDRTGIRHGQKVSNIHSAVRKAIEHMKLAKGKRCE